MRISSLHLSTARLLTVVVVACTGILLWADGRRVDTFVGMGTRAGVPAGRPLLVVAFQARDCDSNLGFLSVLERPELGSNVTVVGLFSGPRDEFESVMPKLNARYPHVRFDRVRSSEARLLGALGHRATPFWLFLDGSGALLLSGQAPSTPLAYPFFAESLVQTVRVSAAVP